MPQEQTAIDSPLHLHVVTPKVGRGADLLLHPHKEGITREASFTRGRRVSRLVHSHALDSFRKKMNKTQQDLLPLLLVQSKKALKQFIVYNKADHKE